jgi:hypothetical protein
MDTIKLIFATLLLFYSSHSAALFMPDEFKVDIKPTTTVVATVDDC